MQNTAQALIYPLANLLSTEDALGTILSAASITERKTSCLNRAHILVGGESTSKERNQEVDYFIDQQ